MAKIYVVRKMLSNSDDREMEHRRLIAELDFVPDEIQLDVYRREHCITPNVYIQVEV